MSNLPSIPPPFIDLGAFGRLINPVQVDGGKIFYFWDLNGDGFANANAVAGILVNGDAGKGAGPDTGSHDSLDAIFKFDINGNVNPDAGTNTSETYRFASVEGYRFALPTAGAMILYGSPSPTTGLIDPVKKPGTSVGSVSPKDGSNFVNPTYDDMLAIWDAYNGKSVGQQFVDGFPPKWDNQATYFWTASRSPSGHTVFDLGPGLAFNSPDGAFFNVVVELLAMADTTAPEVTNTSAVYNSALNTLTLTGTGYNSQLESDESSATDIKARFNWSNISWNIDNGVTARVNFALGDIAYAVAVSDTQLEVTLGSDKSDALEATAGYAGLVKDTIAITAGFSKDAAGNAASLDGLNNAPITVSEGIAIPLSIDLGGFGKLILPVRVDGGHWYYFWDRSGDGTSTGVDYTSHEVLDSIFKFNSSGQINPTPGTGTTDTYRFATLNGVTVALPTVNGSTSSGPSGINNLQTGTDVGSPVASVGSAAFNGSYDDLLAIWDAYNGKASVNYIQGVPPGWQASSYWSALPSGTGHAFVMLDNGFVLGDANTRNGYVALEVFPSLLGPRSTISNASYISANDTLVINGSQFLSLLANGEAAPTNIATRLDWGKLTWDINGDNATTANVQFSASDILSAIVISDTQLTVTLTTVKAAALEASRWYGGLTVDKLDITTGFTRNLAGIASTTDGIQNAPLTVSAFVAGDLVIDLEGEGQLNRPIQVDGGRWYYFWDRNGDGRNAVEDSTTNRVLDGIFNNNISNTAAFDKTTDIFRYASINGVPLALPTSGGPKATTGFPVQGLFSGTTIGSASANTGSNAINISYADLMAVWDAYNGTGTEKSTIGTPPGWVSAPYWSSTRTDGYAIGNILINGSFELGIVQRDLNLRNTVDYTASDADMPGWISVSGFEVWWDLFLGNRASDGIAFLELDNGYLVDAYSSTLFTQLGIDYNLSFDLARRNQTNEGTNKVEFFVNNQSLGVFTPINTTFTTFTVSFVGTGSDTIMFRELATANDSLGGLIDNLRVTAPYQEALAAVNLTKGSIYPWPVSGGAGAQIYVALEVFPTITLKTTNVSSAYESKAGVLNLNGTQYLSLLASNEDVQTTNIAARLDWSKLTWDIDGDNATTANVQFLASDISSAIVISDNQLRVTLTPAKAAALEAAKGYGGEVIDTLDIATGFLSNATGLVAKTDGVENAPLNVSPIVPGDKVIDLGALNGQLIFPVYVDGKWYYYWDRSGDGSALGADTVTHDVLDGIFKFDILGQLNPSLGTNTTDAYRYATLNNINLALPTLGGDPIPKFSPLPPNYGTIISSDVAQFTPSSFNSPSNETSINAIDGRVFTKYLNFDRENAGFTITLNQPKVITAVSFTTANDFPLRDPTKFTIQGSNDGAIWVKIAEDAPISLSNSRFAKSDIYPFANTIPYSYYFITFPEVKAGPAADRSLATDSVQIAEVTYLYDKNYLVENIPPSFNTIFNPGLNGSISINFIGLADGTAIDNIPVGENNPSYNDLLAVWDAINGIGTGQNQNGTPANWAANAYWAATTASMGHSLAYLPNGSAYGAADVNPLYVALQVIGTVTANQLLVGIQPS